MQRSLRISLLITCYNKAEYIAEAISSALRNDCDDIVVIDDCSTDNSRDIIKSFSSARVRTIFLDENKGVSYATKIGAKACQNDYVALLDGDDLIADNTLAYYKNIIDRHHVCAVYTQCVRHTTKDLRSEVKCISTEAPYTIVADPKKFLLKKRLPSTTAVCVRKCLIENYINENIYVQDIQIGFICVFFAKSIATSNSVTHYCSPVGENNISYHTVRTRVAFLESYVSFYKKNILNLSWGYKIWQSRILGRVFGRHLYPVGQYTVGKKIYKIFYMIKSLFLSVEQNHFLIVQGIQKIKKLHNL